MGAFKSCASVMLASVLMYGILLGQQSLRAKIFLNMTSDPKDKQTSQSGFTLVEIAIVIVIVGFLTVAGIQSFISLRDSVRIRTTQSNMEVIADALSAYAARNYRIPCPADPVAMTGVERGFGVAGALVGTCAGANLEGIIPYQTLGLSADFIRDGWGNFITYRVSRAYTLDPEIIATDVHRRCRTPLWSEGGRNLNPLKARFCCSGEFLGDDVQIDTLAGAGTRWVGPLNPDGSFNGRDPVNGNYASVCFTVDAVNCPNQLFDYRTLGGHIVAAQAEAADNIIAMAYYLVSHGKNGLGAFIAGGGRVAQTNAGVPETYAEGGADEQANARSDSRFVTSLQTNTDPANYFDDIVFFQTNMQLLSRLAGESCLVP